MKGAHNYKTLYQDCAKQSADKDNLLILLQQQLIQLVSERQTFQTIISEQQGQLTVQTVQLHEQQALLKQQQQTILDQAEKLAQQQVILHEQNTRLTEQQKELSRNKQEILQLTNLRYELMNLKKWIYGIKSEKRHLPSAEQCIFLRIVTTLSLDADHLFSAC